jgi:7-keto-8-aminopelargonate synthetase-like enzyme
MEYFTDRVPGRTIFVNKQEYLYFGGTSYLGIQSDSGFKKLLLKNITSYGIHHGASRISNLQLSVYDEAEQHLATWAGSPAALTVSSGFLAGQLVCSHFNNEAHRIFTAPNAHTAITSPNQKQYRSLGKLTDALNSHVSGKNPAIPVLFMDSIDLSGNTYPDYRILNSLPLKQVILVADDSHGLGILGDQGAGAYRMLARLALKELLICGSLGKALGLQGGVVFGSSERINKLRESSFFAGASPPSPALMATMVEARPIYADKRTSLLVNVALFEKECKYLHRFSHLQGYPVYGFNDSALTSRLSDSGIFVTDFQYPSVQNGALPGRIVLSAHHTEQDIRHLAGQINAYFHI